MKITKLVIYGYGKFVDQTIEIDSQFQAFVGPNEAGKTTIARFIHDMLFGFPTRKSSLNRYEPKNSSRYGGELFFEHNHTAYQLTRVAGKAGGDFKLKNITSQTDLPHQDLHTLINPIDMALYDEVFNLTDHKLDAVLQLTQQDIANRIRLIGTVGSHTLTEMIDAFKARSDELYRPRGRKQPIAVELENQHQLGQKIQVKRQDYRHYQDLVQLAESLKKQLEEAHETIQQITNQHQHLQSLVNYWPAYERYHTLSSKLSDTGHTSEITESTWQQFLKLQMALEQLQQQLNALEQRQAPNGTQSRLMRIKQQNLGNWQQLVDQLPEMLQTQLRLSDFKQTVEKLAWEQEQLSADVGDTIPFDVATEAEVSRLLETQPSRQTSRSRVAANQSITSQRSYVNSWSIAGTAILLLGLLFLPGGVKVFGAIVGLWLIGYGVLQGGNVQSPRSTSFGNQTGSETRLREISAAFQMQSFPYSQWFVIQAKLQTLEKNQGELTNAQTQVKLAEQKLTDYQQRWQSLLNQPMPQATFFADLKRHLNEVEVEERTNTESLTNQKILQQRSAEIQRAIVTQTAAMQALLAQNREVSVADFETHYHQQQAAVQDRATQSALNTELTPDLLSELGQYDQLATLQTKVNQLATQLSKLNDQQQVTTLKLAETKMQVARLTQDATYEELLQQQAAKEEQINDLVFEWLSNQLAAKLVGQVVDQAVQNRQPEILTLTKTYFKLLTQNRYNEVNFTEQGIRLTRFDEQQFDVVELSKGTAQQLYLAVALAFAVTIGRQLPMPILIDDAFVSFDGVRRQTALKLLEEISRQNQVIYFTAGETVKMAFDATQVNLLTQ